MKEKSSKFTQNKKYLLMTETPQSLLQKSTPVYTEPATGGITGTLDELQNLVSK